MRRDARPRTLYWASAVAFAPTPAPTLADDAGRRAEQLLREARDVVPAEIPVTTRLSRKPIRAALVAEFEHTHHDLVIMGSRGDRVWVSGLRRSVNRFVLRHSPVPVLLIHIDPVGPRIAKEFPVAGQSAKRLVEI